MNSLLKTLKEMNWHRGRGDVRYVRYDDCTKTSGYVFRRIPTTPHHGFIEKRRFAIKDGRVYAFGSSKKL